MYRSTVNQSNKYEKLVAQGPEVYVGELEKTGWFKGRSETPEEFVNKLKAQTADQSFCERLVDFNFFDIDIDGHGDSEDYKDAVTTLLGGTSFPTASVEANYNQGKDELSLSVKTTTNHTYKFSFTPFNLENLELGEVVEKFLNKIIPKEGIDEQFFSIPEEGSVLAWTVTAKKIYQEFKRRGLVPAADYFIGNQFDGEEEEDEMGE